LQLVEKSIGPLSTQGKKILSGLFAELGTLNQNGRRYPDDIYESAYEELIPKIKDKRLLGELDHPVDYDEVRLSNVSHVITDCEILEDQGVKKVYGSVELLDTPAGLIAQSLVEAGIPLGISSRGVGSTRQVRDGVEVTDLKLITYDLVADPSFANAVLSPDQSKKLSDSLEYIESKLPLNESLEHNSIRDMIHNIRESLISKKTTPTKEISINKAETDNLKRLLETAESTIKSDTEKMIESRKEIKSLRRELMSANKKYESLLENMFNLQEDYNRLKEASTYKEKINSLELEIVELRKNLAVEKRGMSYSQVSELLEGANTIDEIENRLNSLSSVGRKRQTTINIQSNTLTESTKTENPRLSGLAAIVSRV